MADPGAGERSPRAGVTVAVALACVALVVLNVVVIVVRSGDDSSVAYGSLTPGACIERPPVEVRSVDRTPCDQPHDLEVVAVVEDPSPPGAAYPGKERLIATAAEACAANLRARVGAGDVAQFNQLDLVPSETSWKDGNRRLVCTLGRADGRPLPPSAGSSA
jgi:hypothetical protein